ncbi:MAG: hypothetical protein CM1200mP10_28940 [Candidatus Neomarinimicrobiota bacterium]|nr:MAG: hypothetical protein CM1200mP10_28940 [Candidatus Neomarinimicrobiota bacterium]
MRYLSTNQQSIAVGFREALFHGLAPDRGLYFPESIPEFDHAFYQKEMTYCELAAEMIHPFVSENISSAELMDICNAAFTFDIPVVCLIKIFMYWSYFMDQPWLSKISLPDSWPTVWNIYY